jgi:hypothetical protein
MIEIKYEDISAENFTQALHKLARVQVQAKVAYAIKKLVDEVNKARRAISGEFEEEVAKKYAKRDEKGDIMFDEDGHFIVADEHTSVYMEETKAFGKKLAKIDRFKIPLAWIGNAQGVSASDIAALEPVLDEDAPLVPQNVLPLTPGA